MFVIVRHGNTFETGEPPRRIGARTDLSLTRHGRSQAERLGRLFAEQRFDFARIEVSPLARTRQTAQEILRHLPGAPAVNTAEWLREIDHGPDENQPEDAVIARIGRDALTAWDHWARPPAGWIVDAETRVASWRALFARDQGPTLLVTSNGAARFALIAAGLDTAARASGTMKLAPGSYGIITKSPDGTFAMAHWGIRP